MHQTENGQTLQRLTAFGSHRHNRISGEKPDMEIQDMDATTLTAIGTLATGGVTAIGTLWKWMTARLDAADKKLATETATHKLELAECHKKHDDCERRAEETQREVGQIKHRLGDLEGYVRAVKELTSDKPGPHTPPPEPPT